MASYSKKNLILVIFRNLFLLLVLVFIFQYAYKRMDTQLKERQALQARYEVINNDLENFVTLQENMYETKLKIEEIIGSMPGEYVPNQELSANYRDRIFSVADEYAIKITTDTVERDENDKMSSIIFGFKAKYEATYKFLFAIEMFSKVKSFSIDENNNVIIESSPILYRSAVDSYFSGRAEKMDDVRAEGYFKEIFDLSEKKVNTIGHIPSWRDIDPAPQDPFYEYIPPKTSVKTKRVVRRKPPPIDISGIIYDSQNPIVIIDSKLYRQGDFYKTVKILTIKERTITVELDGQKYIIKFDKEGK